MNDEALFLANIAKYASFPHCDDLVLHAPGDCKYCDLYPEDQRERTNNGINFTGKSDPSMEPCPSTLRRPLEVIERWPGNRAYGDTSPR